MDQATHNKVVSFIWGIADYVLRDLFKRGKYPDVIPAMPRYAPLCLTHRPGIQVLAAEQQLILR